MSVVVVRNPSHVVVDVVLDGQFLPSYQSEPVVHVGECLGRGRAPVAAPDNHRYVADLAVGDPANVVLVEPSREAFRLAELAAGHVHPITVRD